MPQYPTYANSDDRKCARKLVDTILQSGYGLALNDGEETVIKAGKNQPTKTLDYLKEMASTGEDHLTVYDLNTRERIGSFWLIYNNGSEGDPMILIADYSYRVGDKRADEIWNTVNNQLG